MTEFLERFSLQAVKFDRLVLLAMVAAWITVLICTGASIMSQPFSRHQRVFWLAVIILLPGIGVLAYLPFSYNKEDLPEVFFSKRQRHTRHTHKRERGTTTRNSSE